MNSNGATDDKLDGAGIPGAVGGAGRQPLNFRGGFGALWLAHRASPQPRKFEEFSLLVFSP